ncbi:hypothetical protein [Winogradskyella flava]|uniref:Uncharacterized protein n=1 Tax=Winogradskyella flava TaxID=1884876 RepID=A0A842IL90_9FLAO|nr:hypothetical protein [Winogradskyella flava]MBC2843461.1 hypothetical protein [Winogradskyella flava]
MKNKNEMMKRLTLLAIILIGSLSIEAQNYNVAIRDMQNIMDINSAVNIKERLDVEGSPYVQDKFEPIKLKGLEAKVSAKYNAYLGQMHLKAGEEVISLNVNSDYEVKFIGQNKTYRTFSYKSLARKSERGFLVVIKETDKFQLLKEELIIFKNKIPAKNSYVREVPAKYTKGSDTYYFMLNDEVVHFPTKKKDLIKAFPDIEKKLKSYIKDNKLSTKKESDLIQIAEYISSNSEDSKEGDEK